MGIQSDGRTDPNQYSKDSVEASDNIYFKSGCISKVFAKCVYNGIHPHHYWTNYFQSGCISVTVVELLLD